MSFLLSTARRTPAHLRGAAREFHLSGRCLSGSGIPKREESFEFWSNWGSSLRDPLDGSASEVELQRRAVQQGILQTKPWSRTMIQGKDIVNNAKYNKGLAFTRAEREALHLRGLFPACVVPMRVQVDRFLGQLRSEQDPLSKYRLLVDLQERNETLFYRVIMDNLEECMPLIYTPTVGKACQMFGFIWNKPRGMYISASDRGNVAKILTNWPEQHIRVVCVTDGERILGLGDLGAYGMGIPVGKLSLYTACAGIPPMDCLPVVIDVGTNNDTLLEDELYVGLRQKRLPREEFDELIEEFMDAVKMLYGPSCLVQFEDFGNTNAFRLLEKYREVQCCFNDDIQGTASVCLSGIISSLRITGGELQDKTFLFLGAGEAGTGIADLIASTIAMDTGCSMEQARSKIFLVDSKGLVVQSRADGGEQLQHHKLPYTHDVDAATNLLEAVEQLKPQCLIGVSAVPKTFTKEVCEAMASINERPVIMALSNPTSQAECSAEEAYTWTDGKCIFASGSPFDPVEYGGQTFSPGQGNNAYVFPGIGLGLNVSRAVTVTDEMMIIAARELADLTTEADLEMGCVYPPFNTIRQCSHRIACAVASNAYERGLATALPMPGNLEEYVQSQMYQPAYPRYA